MNKTPLEIDFRKKIFDEITSVAIEANSQLDKNHLQIILDTIPIPIYYKNANSEYTGCNMAFEKAMGISRERLIGKTIFDFADIESANIINSLEYDVLQTKTVKESEEILKYADGTYHNVIMRKAPFLNSNWQTGGVVGVIFDVTEQKATENLLKHRFELDKIITSVSAFFIQSKTADINFGIKQTMEKLSEFLNAEHSYLYLLSENQNSFKLIYSTFSRPVIRMEEISAEFVKSFSWGFDKLRNFKTVNLSVEDHFPAEALNIKELLNDRGIKSILTIPLVFGNALKGFIGFERYIDVVDWKKEDLSQLETIADIFINALERKNAVDALEAEREELSVTLRSIADGVITTDLQDNILIVNRAAEEITGWNQDELSAKSSAEFFSMISADKKNLGNHEIQKIFIEKVKKLAFVDLPDEIVVILSKDNKKKTVAVSCTELKDNQSNLRGFVYVIKDITELLKIEKQLSLSQKMESVGQLASGIAHEINTPMQYIGDNTSFLKDSITSISKYINEMRELIKSASARNNFPNLSDELTKLESELGIEFLMNEIPVAIQQTQSGVQHVSKIVLAMKDFAHPSAKEKSLVNINKGIEVTATISKNAWKYSSKLELKLDPDLPDVFCVLDEINQVLLNIIVNANDAIKEANINEPEKMGKILIETGTSDNFIFIKITDNGIGIKNEHISRVFDHFFTTKEVGKGTGQGLSLAHDIIFNKHNGKITIDSIPGKGTTFTINLPLAAGE